MERVKKYGYYSRKMAAVSPSQEYESLTSPDSTVITTCIGYGDEKVADWDDLICVGEVGEMIRRFPKGSNTKAYDFGTLFSKPL